jgi:hypothetical protein
VISSGQRRGSWRALYPDFHETLGERKPIFAIMESAVMESMTKRVICPACGAWIEAETDADLIRLSRRHTLTVHGYMIPDDHVLRAAELDDAPDHHTHD